MKAYCRCEKCGGKADVDISKVLTSLPAKYEYICKNDSCNYHGYVLIRAVNFNTANDEDSISGIAQNLDRNRVLNISSPTTGKGQASYPSHNPAALCDCTNCMHEPVCKFKERYKKKASQIDGTLDAFVQIEAKCIYYASRYSNLNITYEGTDTNHLFNPSNPCSTCNFTRQLLRDGTYIGDSPCEWCVHNPFKLTCKEAGTPTAIASGTSLPIQKTVINEAAALGNTADKSSLEIAAVEGAQIQSAANKP